MISEPIEHHETVVHALFDAVEKKPEREALVCGTRRLTYREYGQSVVAFANQLRALEVQGRCVAVIMGNSIETCIAMYATQLAGAVLVPLNPAYTDSELRPMLEDCSPAVVIFEPRNAQRDQTLAAAVGATTFSIGPEFLATIPQQGPWHPDPRQMPSGAHLGALQFTGGTTGRSKGVQLSHRAIAINQAQRNVNLPAEFDHERLLCVMPLFHVYAIHMCLHNMVNCRGTLVIMEKFDPAALLTMIATERITVFAGSPTLFAGLMNHPCFESADFSSLEITYSGASALSAELLQQWQTATGTPVIEGYGQSESGPVVSFNPLNGPRKLASVGPALPLTEIEIVDLETGREVQLPNTQGEIRLRGPQIMDGYLNRGEETRLALREGWLYTGDIGELDDDGYLFIRGRKKELIIVSGFNVYPREIEDVVASLDGVVECAVIGIEDEYRGELPLVVVVVQADSSLSEEPILDHCKLHLTKYKQPAAVRFVDGLPKTSVGKLDRVTLEREMR
ncbi:MAG: AMP-binding protein [Pseudomonadota bacterium]